MLIPVIYPNGSHDMVKDFYLDYLISQNKIGQFRRSSGWVDVQSANLRGKAPRNSPYHGPERRLALLDKENAADTIEFVPAKDYNMH